MRSHEAIKAIREDGDYSAVQEYIKERKRSKRNAATNRWQKQHTKTKAEDRYQKRLAEYLDSKAFSDDVNTLTTACGLSYVKAKALLIGTFRAGYVASFSRH